MTLRTTVIIAPQVSQVMAGTLCVITWENCVDDEQSLKDADSSDEDDAVILELARQRVCYPAQRTNAKALNLTDRNLQRTRAMILGEPPVLSRMVDSLEPPRTLYEVGPVPDGDLQRASTFQRAMNVTFQNFVNKTRLTQGMINFCVIVYMDDILVYSKTYHGHVQHIEWTLGALRDAGFKIALEKSEFFLSEISFLGYVVTRGILRPDSRKVATVKDAPVPTSLTQEYDFDIVHRKTERHGNTDGLTRLHRPAKPIGSTDHSPRVISTASPILSISTFVCLLLRCGRGRRLLIARFSFSVSLSLRYSVPITIAMSFLTERVLGEHLLVPRDDISAIRQVHHTRISPDLLRFAQFFSTTGVYEAAEFRFATHSQALVLAEASAYRRLSIPGVSQVSTIVVFSGDISTVDPLRHTTIRVSLRKWGEQLAAEWNQWLARHGDNLVVTNSIDAGGLRMSRQERAVAEEAEVEDGSEEDTSEEEGSYSEYSEEEPGEEEEEEEEEEDQLEEEEGSKWETLGEEADRAEVHEEDPETAARRREEIAARKQPLEYASCADLPIPNDPTNDPEPPKNDDGDLAAETSSAPARR
ncbi:hypothetical protein CBR_g1109 [Chara braunii]|uniref:Reverse transcriptase domain-containing protein n=1 Tax=Chara braunii TaxID=69332 RepID=A0A388KD61_CHABU|nr:hypothetical protein CBR_g1109 [Chara braunii]|eukprot:GBG67990.1 hypothetical protein CBR_g1109 [Chara braunii]